MASELETHGTETQPRPTLSSLYPPGSPFWAECPRTKRRVPGGLIYCRDAGTVFSPIPLFVARRKQKKKKIYWHPLPSPPSIAGETSNSSASSVNLPWSRQESCPPTPSRVFDSPHTPETLRSIDLENGDQESQELEEERSQSSFCNAIANSSRGTLRQRLQQGLRKTKSKVSLRTFAAGDAAEDQLADGAESDFGDWSDCYRSGQRREEAHLETQILLWQTQMEKATFENNPLHEATTGTLSETFFDVNVGEQRVWSRNMRSERLGYDPAVEINLLAGKGPDELLRQKRKPVFKLLELSEDIQDRIMWFMTVGICQGHEVRPYCLEILPAKPRGKPLVNAVAALVFTNDKRAVRLHTKGKQMLFSENRFAFDKPWQYLRFLRAIGMRDISRLKFENNVCVSADFFRIVGPRSEDVERLWLARWALPLHDFMNGGKSDDARDSGDRSHPASNTHGTTKLASDAQQLWSSILAINAVLDDAKASSAPQSRPGRGKGCARISTLDLGGSLAQAIRSILEKLDLNNMHWNASSSLFESCNDLEANQVIPFPDNDRNVQLFATDQREWLGRCIQNHGAVDLIFRQSVIAQQPNVAADDSMKRLSRFAFGHWPLESDSVRDQKTLSSTGVDLIP